MKAWQITKKDLLLQVRDFRALTILVLVPLIFIMILGTTFGRLLGWKAENQVLKLAFIDKIDYASIADDEEGTKQVLLNRNQKDRNARQLLVSITNSMQERKGIAVELVPAERQEEQEKLLEKGDIAAIVTFGPEFFARVDRLDLGDILDEKQGKLAGGLDALDVTVEQKQGFEGTGSVVDQMMSMTIRGHIASYVACREGSVARAKIADRCRSDWERSFSSTEPLPKPNDPEPLAEEGTDKSAAVYDRVVPGLTVMFVFFLVNIMARSFIHERELGTLRRLQIAPIGPASLLAGKTVPFLVVSLVQSAVLFGCGKLLFNMSFGPEPWLMIPVVFCTSLSATGLGLMLATLVKTDSQVSAYSNLVVITMAGISGCLVPRDMLPYQLLQISLATPHAWAVEAFRQLLPENQGVPDLRIVAMSCAMLIAFSIVFFLVGVTRFARSRG